MHQHPDAQGHFFSHPDIFGGNAFFVQQGNLLHGGLAGAGNRLFPARCQGRNGYRIIFSTIS